MVQANKEPHLAFSFPIFFSDVYFWAYGTKIGLQVVTEIKLINSCLNIQQLTLHLPDMFMRRQNELTPSMASWNFLVFGDNLLFYNKKSFS